METMSADNLTRTDRPDIFFQRNSNNSFTPRALLIDLEPRVIGKILDTNNGLFDPKNVYLSPDGMGAGNRWGEGYVNGRRSLESVLDIIDRELDGCDNLEGFQLLHSVSGGTGAGFGSLLLETLSDRYNKKLIQTYSVFGDSEVVVSPYNSILTLKRLIQNSDANIIFNNNTLMSVASNDFVGKDNKYDNINELISTVMSASTNTLRFPSYSFNSLTSIISTLIPTPDLHFITPSYTPFTLDYVSNAARDIRRSTSYDVILELLDKKLNMFCTKEQQRDDKVLAMIDIIIGANNSIDNKHNASIQKALIKASSRIAFAPWTPSTIHLAVGTRSPYSKTDSDIVSGLMLTNSTSVLQEIKNITKNYDQLMRKNAFMNNFLKGDFSQECGDLMQEFQESREVVEALIGEYKASETLAYMEGGYEDEEEDNSEMRDDVPDADNHEFDNDVVME